jgi:hypothetical protein
VTVIVPQGSPPPAGEATVLFTQPILTRPGLERVALLAPVGSLAPVLNGLRRAERELEHVYDY